MKPIKALIFDMDGVIVDSEPLHTQAFLDVFKELGYPGDHGLDFEAYYGHSDPIVWKDFCRLHHPPQSLDELTGLKQKRFLELLINRQPLFPEIERLLELLARRFTLGLASGSPHRVIGEVLGMRNLRRFFSAVVSAEDVPRGKPAPDVFLKAALILNTHPSDCCVIEDAAVGVEAALAAGMQVIAITNSLPQAKLSRATKVVSTYGELESLLVAS